MQAEDPQALRELLACSLALRPKHVDRKFLHRRRMRGKSAMSQQWFVSIDNWIAGTAADVQAAPAFFDIEVGPVWSLCMLLQGRLCSPPTRRRCGVHLVQT